MSSTYNPTRVINLGALGQGTGATIVGAAAGDYAGYSVSGAGDVNGDGIDDILVGAPNNYASESGSSDPGNAYVIFGRAGGLGTIDLSALDDDDDANDPGIKITGAHNSDFAGWSVSKAGDVNGDGVADFVIGVPYSDVATADDNGGNAYVIFGKTDAAGGLGNIDLSVFDGDAPENAPGIKISGVSGSLAGVSVSNAGDVNGDGIDDLLVGANNSDPNNIQNAGNTYVIFGATQAAGGLGNIDLAAFDDGDSSNDPGIKISGAGAENYSGYAVSAAGDVNGDGVDDLILGAPQADGYAGASYVIYGKKQADGGLTNIDLSAFDDTDATNDPGFRISGAQTFGFAGYSVSGAGDVNGDGVTDLIVGANWANALGRSYSGAAYVIYGKVGGVGNIDLSTLSLNQGYTILGATEQAFTGVSVSDAGDVNGDGYDDVIVGAFYEGEGGSKAGASYVIYGRSGSQGSIDLSAVNPSRGFKIAGVAAGDQSGYAVSAAGDVNGDGFADVIVGAYGADTAGKTDAGAAYVVYGSAISGSPSIVSVTSSNADGFYKVGDTISITVNFSDLVNVLIGSGTPRLLLETGETDHYAIYSSGSGTKSLNFTYTVAADDVSSDLSYVGLNALDLNGARIRSATTNVDAALVLPVPGEAGSLSASSDIALGADPVPVATLPDASTIDYNEQASAVSVFSGLELSDGDSASLASATVAFANFQADEDILAMTATSGIGNITSSFDATTGQLTLTSDGSSASLAEWQAALRSITFNNTSDTPDVAERTLTLVVSDGTNQSSALTRQIDVHAVNDLPVAGNDTFSIDEDTATTFNVLENDSDVDGTRLTIRAINGVAVKAEVKEEERFAEATAEASTSASAAQIFSVDHGTVQINSDGGLKFTPDSDFTGTTSFTYTVSDERGGAQTATVTVDVLPVNDAPVAGSFEYTAQEDQALTLDVVAQSTDADGDALQISAVDGKVLTAAGVQVTGGLVTLNAQGTLLFTPNTNYTGPVNFTYTLNDGHGGLSDGQIGITVQPVNDAPVAGNDTFSIEEDTAATFNVLGNDSDVDGARLTIRAINGIPVKTEEKAERNFVEGMAETSTSTSTAQVFTVDHGTVRVNADGSLNFTPASNFTGPTSFTYTVSDEFGSAQTATVTVDVLPVNDAPEAQTFNYTIVEDKALALDVAAQGTDADGDALQISAVDGKVLTAAGVQVTGGLVTLNAQGALLFTPTVNYNGPANFTYTLNDGHGGLSDGQVNITVLPVNDAPVLGNDKFIVTERETVVLSLLANDSDPENDTLRITAINGISVPAAGNAGFNVAVVGGTIGLGNDGKLSFTAAANYGGNASFTYTVSDGHGGASIGTVTGTVISVNEAPVAGDDTVSVLEDAISTFSVLGNDKDVDGDALRVVAIDGQLLTSTVGSNGALSTIPVAVANGSVVMNPNGSLAFTPKANFNGDTSFTYRVSDGQGGTDTATVKLTVTPVNDAPVAANDSFTVAADVGTTLNLLANDSDIDGDTLRIVAINGVQINSNPGEVAVKSKSAEALAFTSTVADGTTGSASTATSTATSTAPASSTQATTIKIADGTLVLNADGTVLFTPNSHFSGKTTFTYSVSDSHGGTSTATAAINVIAAPVASDDIFTVAEDGAVVLDLLSNDTGDGALSLVEVNGVAWREGAQAALAGGIVSRNADGALQFKADANFTGDIAFTYGVTDSHGTRTTGRVSGTVTPVNDAPTAHDVSFAVAAGVKSQRIDVGAGTKDIDGDLVRVLAVDGKVITASAPVALASGTVSLAADGNLIFSPLATFSGTASFAYTLTDDHGGTDSARLTGEVQAVKSWSSFGTALDKVLGDLGLSQPNNFNDLLAKATYLAPAAFATGGADTGKIPMGGYHAAAGYDLDLNAATPDSAALSKALATLINAQTYFNTPSVAKIDEKGAVTSAVDQSLLFQSYLKNGSQVHIDDGHGGQDFASAASSGNAWSKAFAQSVLSSGFADDQVTKYDHQSQAKVYQSLVGKDASFAVTLDGVSAVVSKAALALSAAEFVSNDGASAVEIARPVAVAETAGAADDQTAVVRMRQVGANDSSVMFYKVDDFAGTVNGLKPGDAGYEAATNAHAYQTDTGSTWVSGGGYGKYSEATLTHINANDLIAMKLSSAGSTFYAFADANELVNGQHVAHVWSYGLNTWGWEDLYGGGDSDFNDIVVQLDFLKVKTSQDQIL